MNKQDADLNSLDATVVQEQSLHDEGEILTPLPPVTLVAPAIVPTAMQDQEAVQKEQKKSVDHGNMEDDEPPFGWIVVAAAFFVQFMVIGTVNGYGVFENRYINYEYNTSTTFELSWVGTLNIVGMDLMGPITGQLADHFGYRISCFIGALIMGVSLIATSFSTRVWELYIFQGFAYGFGASMAFFPSLALPSQYFKKRRGLATGAVVAGGGVGGLALSPMTTALFSRIGYKWTVRTLAILHLAVIIPAAFLFKPRIESGKDQAKRLKREQSDRELAMTATTSEKPDSAAAMGVPASETMTDTPTKKQKSIDFSVLKEKPFLVLFFIGFLSANGYFNPLYWFSSYAQDYGTSVSTASLLLGILNGASAIGRVSMGMASDHIGDINTLLISCLFASLSILILWILAGTSLVMMVLFCLMYGFFSGSFVSIIPTVAAHLCGISRLASVTGIVYGGIAIGSLVGSPVGGALLDLGNSGKDYRPMQLWAGLMMGAGAMLCVVLKFMMNSKILGRV